MKADNQEKQEMRVRAVAVVAAIAVWCVSGAATAAGYAEVWNPPEAAGHAAKPGKKKTGAVKVKSTAGQKTTSKHVASAQQAKHGSVKKVAVKTPTKGAAKSATKATGAGKTQSKAAVVVQGKKPHAQLVQTKPGQGKIVQANLVQGHTAGPHTVKVAAKTGAAKPVASHANVPAQSANVSANPASTTSNPATVSSGSLPPILH